MSTKSKHDENPHENTYSSSESVEFSGWTITVYRRLVGSTQDGNSNCFVCSAVIVCKGLGALVETARMTAKFHGMMKDRQIGRRDKIPTCNRMIPSLFPGWYVVALNTTFQLIPPWCSRN